MRRNCGPKFTKIPYFTTRTGPVMSPNVSKRTSESEVDVRSETSGDEAHCPVTRDVCCFSLTSTRCSTQGKLSLIHWLEN